MGARRAPEGARWAPRGRREGARWAPRAPEDVRGRASGGTGLLFPSDTLIATVCILGITVYVFVPRKYFRNKNIFQKSKNIFKNQKNNLKNVILTIAQKLKNGI